IVSPGPMLQPLGLKDPVPMTEDLKIRSSVERTSRRSVRYGLGAVVAIVTLACLPNVAAAHVKWFCPYDVSEAPKNLGWGLDRDFICLICVAASVFTVAALIENTILGRAIIWSMDRVTAGERRSTETLMRAVYGAFFVALWTVG